MADDFVFNPDQNDFRSEYRPQSLGLITRIFMKLTGSTSTEATNKVMLGVAIVFLAIAAVVLVIYL